jgi:hypothetical protein
MKRITSIAFLSVLLIAVTLFSEGCYYDNAKDLYPIDTVFVDSLTTDSNATYAYADVESIIANNCATSGCHASGNGSGRQPLSNYSEVKASIESFRLKERVAEGSMPPGGSLSASDKNKLIDWINQGYPEN